MLGNLVGLTANASIDASGETGGGTLLIGGDYQGKNAAIQNAFRTYVGPDATIKADAITSGNGGKVIVWGDDVTRYFGTASARGGAQAGNGGFVEVSGKGMLNFSGLVDLRAPNGQIGTLLLDPTNVFIATNQVNATAAGMVGNDTSAGTLDGIQFGASGAVTDSLLTVGTLTAQLGFSNVAVVTSNAAGTGLGNITVVDPVTWSANQQLRLLAHNNITINGAITSTVGGLFDAYAGWNGGSITTPVITPGTGNININQNVSVTGNSSQIMWFQAGNAISVAGGVAIQNTGGFNNRTNFESGGNITFGAGSSVIVSNLAGFGGSGGIGILSNGNVSLATGTTISASGASAPAVGAGFLGDGGNATVGMGAAGTLSIAGSTVTATGGAGNGVSTGNGTVTLQSGAAMNISGQSIVRARGGGAGVSVTGRPGALSITTGAGNGLTIDGTGNVTPLLIEAIGGTANQTPGAATTTLNVGGSFTLTGNAQVRAQGGAFPVTPTIGGDGSAATVAINFGGAMTFSPGAAIEALGGNTGGGATLDGIGGAALVTIAPTGGTGNVDISGNGLGAVFATGGDAANAISSTAPTSGGAATINLTANGLLNVVAGAGEPAVQAQGGQPVSGGLGGNSIVNATGGAGINVSMIGVAGSALVATTTGTGSAVVTLTANSGGISVFDNARVSTGDGGNPARFADTLLLALGSGGFINLVGANSLVGAYSNDFSRVRLQTNGNASIQGILRAQGHARFIGSGAASVNIDAGAAGINILPGSVVEATGSNNIGVAGGSGTVGLNAPGGAIVVDGSSITATGGVSNSGAGGGVGSILLSGASITVRNASTVLATGGNDTTSGGGGATDTFNATSGRVDVDVSSTVSAIGGDGLTNAGNGSIVYSSATGATTGTINATRGTSGSVTGGASVSVAATSGTIDVNGNVTVTPRGGAGTITVNAGNTITNSAGTLRVAAPAGTGSLMTLTAANGIGATGAPIRFFDGTVPITATNGATGGNIVLSQATGNLSVAGWTLTNNFVGGAFDIKSELGNITVPSVLTGNPHPLTNNNGSVILRAANAIAIAPAASAGFDAGRVQASGNVTLIANDMDLQGPVIANAGAGTINIQSTTAGRTIDLGFIGPSATSLALDNAEIGRLSAANLVIGNGANPVVNGGPITVATALTINTPGLPITLNNAGNDFQGVVSLTGGNVTINDVNALTLGTSSIGGTLNATAGGAITQTGAMTSVGPAIFNAGANPVTLSAANDFQGGLAVTGSNVSVNDINALQLSAFNVSGALSVTAGGAITHFGVTPSPIIVSGISSFNAGANAITLTNLTNDFGGAVSLTGGITQIRDANALTLGTLATGALTALSTGALNLGQGTVGGTLTATSNGGALTQSGALTVTGASSVNAGTGAITLTQANDFQGVMSLTGGATSVTDTNGVVLGATNVGTLSLSSPATTIQGATNVAGNFSLPSGTLTINPGGSFGVSGATNILAGATLTTGGAFNAFGPVTVGGTLRGSATGPINAAGQVITVPGTVDLNGGSVTASNVSVTGLLKGIGTVNGNVSNSGTVAPGASPGILNIIGTYTQTASGVLQIEIGGTVPGSGYDQVAVTGNAFLDGTLLISQFGTFVPTSADTFQAVTAGGTVSGTFSSVIGSAAFPGLGASYLSQAVQLAGGSVLTSGLISSALDPQVVKEDKNIFDQVSEEDERLNRQDFLICN